MLRFVFLCALFILTGCEPATVQNQPKEKPSLDKFVGCYSVEKDAPAQIQISAHQDGLGMQMKEPDGSWDALEPLALLDDAQAWQFFEKNSLNLHKDGLVQSIGRPDEVMVLAQLNPDTLALNPHLDSAFLVSLFGAVNTIYQVKCDNVPLQLAPPDGVHATLLQNQ